ncbi:MAG: YraN family protein [Bacteroidales bacterium]|nr:YraN family protein [Bacteroidales bacterium]
MDSFSTYQAGKKGEDTAVEFLEKKGYSILARNYVYRKKEIDIIARDKNTVVFVEVKERSTDYFGQPYDAVNMKKQKSIVTVADNYIRQHNIDMESRFDVVSIVFCKDGVPVIEHIESAFEPV